MYYSLAGKGQQQTNQPNDLAGGTDPNLLLKGSITRVGSIYLSGVLR